MKDLSEILAIGLPFGAGLSRLTDSVQQLKT
jgi:hypothetical protein